MKRIFLVSLVILGSAVAAEGNTRVLKILSQKYKAADLAKGPYIYDPEGTEPVKSEVNNLKINASKLELSAPSGVNMDKAEGQRTAEFSGGVQVERKRLSAKGTNLSYSEKTGLGTLTGSPSSVFAPEKAGDDPVNIKANQMSFDVDTKISTSKGSVYLDNGDKKGNSEVLVFHEDKELAILTQNVKLTRDPKKAGDSTLVITGLEARVLTNDDKKLMLVKGDVKLVDGNKTTTGSAIYYDDKKDTAIVLGAPGKPAISTDSKTKATVSGAKLLQNTKTHKVEVLKSDFTMPEKDFE